ncbi:hypothetical protein GOB57_07825 [Sinorhizobium meliloti]|nr:hypothetical protein [Sinorhizobium meliloti]
MEFEFNYASTITGLLAPRSTEVKTRFVLETTRVELPEYLDEEAPLAYSHMGGWGYRNDTRWLNGAHWKIAPLPEGHEFDPLRLALNLPDFEALYAPLVRAGRPSVMNATSFYGFVDRDKRWHRVDGDTRERDLQAFLAYMRSNTAVIGGQFAYRVMEPCIELRIERVEGDPLPLLKGSQSGPFQTTRICSVTAYAASFLEAEEAAREIVSFRMSGNRLPSPRSAVRISSSKKPFHRRSLRGHLHMSWRTRSPSSNSRRSSCRRSRVQWLTPSRPSALTKVASRWMQSKPPG